MIDSSSTGELAGEGRLSPSHEYGHIGRDQSHTLTAQLHSTCQEGTATDGALDIC